MIGTNVNGLLILSRLKRFYVIQDLVFKRQGLKLFRIAKTSVGSYLHLHAGFET